MYGNFAVYGSIALSVYKIDYTLRCLEYICSVSSPLRHCGLGLLHTRMFRWVPFSVNYVTSNEKGHNLSYRKKTQYLKLPGSLGWTCSWVNNIRNMLHRKNTLAWNKTLYSWHYHKNKTLNDNEHENVTHTWNRSGMFLSFKFIWISYV